ncbi:response regulator [Bacillus sp. FJAT-49711]|uniref:response regulator n=1 Tax=Bacillus sp. FJAT-49711 TaxID=2833585 RepID=UPI001BC9F59C|nr:response regulator [Bacillus sp. FJAT-49711]MBS4219010.1 response regulator [Bacillus sp. FJAT-49711]
MKKVLIVDDQAGVRSLLCAVLQSEECQIYEAANGPQALYMISQYIPDFVLLDIRIPGMDGIEILKRIKETNSNICVTIMTAYSDENLIKQALEFGAFSCLSKPFDIEEVRTLIKRESSRL